MTQLPPKPYGTHGRVLASAEPASLASDEAPARTVRPLVAGLRVGFLTATALGALAFVQTFVASDQTDRYFAWTIEPPLSAAFLGACYGGAIVMLFLASRVRTWAEARVSAGASLLLTALLLVVSLVHLGRFHIHADEAVTLAGTWAFIAAYVVLPLGLAVLVAQQFRVPGDDPPRAAPLPAWARATLAAQAVILLVLGTLLLCAPAATKGVWPWELTPLMGRAVGTWLLVAGVTAALGLRENDWVRVRVPLVGYVVLALLQGVALARYPDTPRWEDPQSWLYAGFLASMLAIGVAGLGAASRARAAPYSAEAPAEQPA